MKPNPNFLWLLIGGLPFKKNTRSSHLRIFRLHAILGYLCGVRIVTKSAGDLFRPGVICQLVGFMEVVDHPKESKGVRG